MSPLSLWSKAEVSPIDTKYDLYVCVFGAVEKGSRHVQATQGAGGYYQGVAPLDECLGMGEGEIEPKLSIGNDRYRGIDGTCIDLMVQLTAHNSHRPCIGNSTTITKTISTFTRLLHATPLLTAEAVGLSAQKTQLSKPQDTCQIPPHAITPLRYVCQGEWAELGLCGCWPFLADVVSPHEGS
jgi:hypothetical protein